MLVLLCFFFVLSAAQDLKNATGMCRLDPHPSVEYRCLVPGSDSTRVCGASEPPGTIVSPECRKPNYYATTPLSFMRCFGGYWDYIARCTPECGRVTPDGKGLVVGGQSVKRGELPWHAGIYKKTTSPYMQVCGGSLISTNVVISAAHCFWKDLEKQLPAFQFAVAVGKLFRPWNNNLDEAQKSNVKVIYLPPRFQGAGANFQEDLAVVIASKEFEYKTYIRPVCLSFDYDFEKHQLQAGNEGKVAGWGLITADGKMSTKLNVVDLPYVEVSTCIADSPPNFREYITGDKICAGTLKPDTALCKGDSGGGLAFSETSGVVERYYLRGVVSAAPGSESACNTAAYTSFTSVLKHEHFIKQFWTQSGQFKCQDGNFISAANHCDGSRDCADGSDETLSACSKKSCSSYLFQCAYGACVDKGSTCNGVQECADGSDEAAELCGQSGIISVDMTSQVGNRCLLPPYPDNGVYNVTNIAEALPGELYDLVTLNITCLPGFRIKGASSLYCFFGQWQDSMPECTLDFRNDYSYHSRGGGWFKVHPVPVDWRTAGLVCHYEGAELASPSNPEITSTIKELVAKAVPKLQVYYSGIRKLVIERNSDYDIPLDKLHYKWDIEETKFLGRPESCLVYSSDAEERDFNCEDALPYICYRKLSEFDELTECGTVDKAYSVEPVSGHCFKVHSRSDPWERALAACRAEGGALTVPSGAAAARALAGLVAKAGLTGPVAVGFRKWGQADSWWTVYGRTLEEAGFEDWCEGCPDNSVYPEEKNETRKSCGGFEDGKLIDIRCDLPYPFVCEKTIDSLTSILV